MSTAALDLGLYTNVFQVDVPDKPVSVMVASTKDYPDLHSLREEIAQRSWNCRIYRVGNRVFGYGEEQGALAAKAFQPAIVHFRDVPDLWKRWILEGLVDHLKAQGYRERSGKGRATLYEPNSYGELSGGRIRVYRGYDLRVIWWKQSEEIRFGLVVDIRWKVQDTNGRRLSAYEIAQHGVMRQLAQIQEELLPAGNINTEVARFRLQNHILPFVNRHSTFSLPYGGTVTINSTPIRVILGE